MRKINSILLASLLVTTGTQVASAQTSSGSSADESRVIVRSDAGVLPVLPLMFDPVTTADLFNEKVVKNSPFAAEFQSETVRILSGNASQNYTSQVVNRLTILVYRDKDGRTRREQTIHATGQTAGTSGTPEIVPAIEIYDPVSGFGYTLYPATRTAYRYKNPADRQRSAHVWDKTPQNIEIISSDRGSDSQSTSYKLAPPRVEVLGNQTIQGVHAIGKRFTTKIPMNAVGNPLEAETVHEVWYAPHLKMLIQSSTRNTQIGEHTFQMTRINQSEPAASLFRVPADYKVIEMGALITETPPDQE